MAVSARRPALARYCPSGWAAAPRGSLPAPYRWAFQDPSGDWARANQVNAFSTAVSV
ncbi:MAG: hypothetical protein ACK57G_07590 [Planctomycetota bacterium]